MRTDHKQARMAFDVADGMIVWPGWDPLASKHPRSQEWSGLSPLRIVSVAPVTMIETEIGLLKSCCIGLAPLTLGSARKATALRTSSCRSGLAMCEVRLNHQRLQPHAHFELRRQIYHRSCDLSEATRACFRFRFLERRRCCHWPLRRL